MINSCVPTALAMVVTDLGIPFNFELIYSTNLANDDYLRRRSTEHGCELVPLGRDIPNVKEWIKENGPVIVGVWVPYIGAHEIVVDSIDNKEVVIRDPAHGWRVTMDTKEFLKLEPKFKGIRKMKKMKYV